MKTLNANELKSVTGAMVILITLGPLILKTIKHNSSGS